MKKSFKHLAVAAAAALATFGATPVLAVTPSYAAIQFFTLNLASGTFNTTDLLPDDGNAAEAVPAPGPSDATYDFGSGPVNDTTGALDYTDPVTGLQVVSAGVGSSGLGMFSAYGMFHGLTVPSTGGSLTSHSALQIMLAPGTEFTFQAGYLNLMQQMDDLAPVYGNASFAGSLGVSIEAGGTAVGGGSFSTSGAIDGVTTAWTDLNPALGGSGFFGWSRLYNFTLSNPTTNSLLASLNFSGTINGASASPAPIPEPTTNLLMAAGLVGMVPALRRRRKAA